MASRKRSQSTRGPPGTAMRKPSSIAPSRRGNVVGIAESGGTLTVAGIVHDILEDRNCRRLGTTVATSTFQRAMVTDRMLLDAARQLARMASGNPFDFRYGLCVFGLMPASPAPGEAWTQFVRMCKAYSVSQHVLEAATHARMAKVVASDAYNAAHALYARVRAPCPLKHMTSVHQSLVATTGRYSRLMPAAGRREARQAARHLQTDEHRIDFLQHVFYLTLAPLAPAGGLSSEAFEAAVRRVENACHEIFGRHGDLARSDAAQRALDMAILSRVPQLYYHLSHAEDEAPRSDAFKARALAAVAKAHATPVQHAHFSRRFGESVRVAERCNLQFMQARGGGGSLESTWSDTVFGEGSYVDDMLELPLPRLTSLLRVFPRALAAISDAHSPLEDAHCAKLKTILARNPAWMQFLFAPQARQCVSG